MYSPILPVCVKPAAPPAAVSPLGWHSDNPLQIVEDASPGQSGCTAPSKTYTKQEISNSEMYTSSTLVPSFVSFTIYMDLLQNS